MNKVVRLLIISDLLLYFALGLLAPIMAIFITGQIVGGTIETVGLATGIFWIVRALSTVPLGRFMDKSDGERDEFLFMFAGTLLLALVPLFYLQASLPWHIYVLQGLVGLAESMALPGWRILFTNNLDRGKTGYEWAMDDIAVGLGAAVSAYAGSLVADHLGFKVLFLCMSVLGFFAAAVLLPIRRHTRTLSEMRRLHIAACEELARAASVEQK